MKLLIDEILDIAMEDVSRILQDTQEIRNHTGRHGERLGKEEFKEKLKIMQYRTALLAERFKMAREVIPENWE